MDTKLKDDKKIKKKDKIKNLFLLLRQKLKPLSPYIIVVLIISIIMAMFYSNDYDRKYKGVKQGSKVRYETKFNREEWRTVSEKVVSTRIYSETQYLNYFDTMSQSQLNDISSKFLSNKETKFLVYNRKSKKIVTNIDAILAPLVSNSDAKSVEDVLSKIDALKNISSDSTEDKLKNLVRNYDNGNDDIEFCLTSSGSPAVQDFPEHLNYIKNSQDYLEIFYPTTEARQNYTFTEQHYYGNEYEDVTWDELANICSKQADAETVAVISVLILLVIGIKNSLEEFKKSIFTKGYIKLKNGIVEFFDAKGLAYKYIGFLGISIVTVISSILSVVYISESAGLIFTTMALIIPAVYIFYILPKTFKFITNLNNIVKGSERIVSGDLNYSIDEEKLHGNLYKLASGINTIKKGFKVSIDEQVKNEKLKSELVANVSHDLKTPLTSIINYTDILMREGLTEEEKQEYIQILNRKSLKLKALIEALFEVSKINSGKVDIEKEEVNVIELLKQSIGEFAISAEEKNLKFKLNTFSNEVIMPLDGKKMARVFENLISNAIKYSMENTRVFIEVEQREQGIRIGFKNISSYDMDFDVNEIFERFTRADKSRTSDIEGNGLGLAIAKSIVELHEGDMNIEKDGDMFKVFIDLR